MKHTPKFYQINVFYKGKTYQLLADKHADGYHAFMCLTDLSDYTVKPQLYRTYQPKDVEYRSRRDYDEVVDIVYDYYFAYDGIRTEECNALLERFETCIPFRSAAQHEQWLDYTSYATGDQIIDATKEIFKEV